MKDNFKKEKENRHFYAQIATSYDQCISWNKRLKVEEPFFRKLFEENQVKKLLDIGCGTGMHAIEFSRWGIDVYGGDFSPEMLKKASENAKSAAVSTKFFLSGLTDVAKHLPERVDAVFCIGTTLPQLLSEEDVKKAVKNFHTVLRPGGILLIQNVNFERMYVDNLRFRPPKSWKENDQEKTFLRIYNFLSKKEAYIDMITLIKEEDTLEMVTETVNMRPIYAEEIDILLRNVGFSEYALYGDYKKSPYDAKISSDLVVLATKKRERWK